MNRLDVIDALQTVARLHHLDVGFDVEVAADAILAGRIVPDWDHGTIVSTTLAFAQGAFMSTGPWWPTAPAADLAAVDGRNDG